MTDHGTDDLMDDRLRAAGARWRAENADAVEPAAPAPPVRRSLRWGLLASAAAVVAVLGTGGVVALSDLGGRSDRGAATGSAGLAGTVWRLVGDRGVTSFATLYVGRDGALVADDSCQVIGADVRPQGRTLVASDVRVRYRGCTDSVGEVAFDPGFVAALRATPRFDLDGRTLRIEGKGETYRFEADPALPRPTTDVPTFDEARWRLVGVRDPSGAALDVPADVTLRIADGRLTTTDGCNTLSGRIGSPNGPSVDGSGLSVTEMACPGRLDTATVLNKVFAGRFQQSVVGGRLTVTRAGAGTLVYDWVPDDTAGTDPANLVGPTWRLTGVAGEPPAAPASLRFASPTSYRADNGCGSFGGAAALGRGTMRLSGVPDEQKGCAGQASTVVSFLGTDTLWTIRDGKLLIFGGGAQAFSLVYSGGSPNPGTTTPNTAADLAGTWALTQVATDNRNSSSGTGGSDLGVTVTFAGGRFRTTGLCGRQNGDYVLSGNELQVRSGGEALCLARGAGRYVQMFLSGGITSRWSVSGDDLTLARGAVTLTFVKK